MYKVVISKILQADYMLTHSIWLEHYTIGTMNLNTSLFLTQLQYVVQAHILVFIQIADVSD